MMEWWNGGIMEYWESKTDDGLILNSDPCHLYKIRSHSGHSSFTGLRFFALFLILSVVVVGWVKRL
jgi:hypothetical protein